MRSMLLSLGLALSPVVATAQTTDPSALWLEGANAFQSGEYAKAAETYQRLVDSGAATADVYFNLGTSELRAGRRGAAIFALERALRLDPNDSDAVYNLAEAQKGNVDKIVGTREEEPILERLGARVPVDTFGPVFLGAWLVLWLALIGRFFAKAPRAALSWVAGITLLAALFSGVGVALAAWQRSSATYAIVVAPEASVREGPAKNFKAAFDVHEGLKVRVVRREQDFLRVRLPNGLEGWVAVKDAPVL